MDRETDSAAGEKAQASTPEPSTEAEDPRPRVTWGAGSAPKSKKEPISKWIWAAIGVTILLLVTIVSYGIELNATEEAQESESLSTTTTTLSPAKRRAAYKAQVEIVGYKRLQKNPNAYLGHQLKFTGLVLQIFEDSETTQMRVAVTQNEWDYSIEDVIYVVYSGSLNLVLRDDVITVWGDGLGSFTYESQGGWNITVPLVQAQYVAKHM